MKKLLIELEGYFTSNLKRASDSLDIILKVLNKKNIAINKAWELNERHYGGLTGLNKDDTIKKYGQEQVQIWRRSFNISPPQMEPEHPYKKVFKNELLRLPIVKSLTVNLKGSEEHTFRCCFQNACLTMLTRFCVVGALSWALLAILEHKTYFNCTI